MKGVIELVIGWMLVALGAFLGLGVLLYDSSFEDDTVEVCTVFLVLGVLLIAHACFRRYRARVKERKKREAELQSKLSEVAAVEALPVVDFPFAIVLKPGEVCHYQTDASTVVTKEKIVGYTGSNGGISVHVARGVTLHSGASRGKAIRQNVATDYPGLFTITNQRMIMTGEKGFDKPINKLTAFSPFGNFDGVILQFGTSQYILRMAEPYWVPKILELINKEQTIK